MCACKMFHGPGTRRAVCSSIHVNIESKQSATLTLCGMGGALVALTFHYCNQLARELLYRWISCKKKTPHLLLFPLRTGLPRHYMCHAISTTGATLLLPRPGIGHRTRQDCHLQLPPSFPFPFLHFTLSSSLRTHLTLVTGVPPRQSRLLPPASPRGNCHRV